MKNHLFIITGATGTIGNAMRSYIEEKMPSSNFLLLQRKNTEASTENHHTIIKDFSKIEKDHYLDLDAVKMISNHSKVYLIMCSGVITPIQAVGEMSQEDIIENININVVSSVIIINEVLSLCRSENKQLYIINLDSGAAYNPINKWSLYCAAKSYLSMFLRVIEAENPSVKIVSLDPGVVDSRMQYEIRKSDFSGVEKFHKYKNDGVLKTGVEVAEYIYDKYIEKWNAESFYERII